jgi:hypothetical protein
MGGRESRRAVPGVPPLRRVRGRHARRVEVPRLTRRSRSGGVDMGRSACYHLRMSRLRGTLAAVSVAACALAGATVGNAASGCPATPTDGFGPFGRGSPPVRASIGKGHVLSGVILSAVNCRPIPRARVELWQANGRGRYVRATSGTVPLRRPVSGLVRGRPAAHPHSRRRPCARGAPLPLPARPRRPPRIGSAGAPAPRGLALPPAPAATAMPG